MSGPPIYISCVEDPDVRAALLDPSKLKAADLATKILTNEMEAIFEINGLGATEGRKHHQKLRIIFKKVTKIILL
jgi:hypothetical protein